MIEAPLNAKQFGAVGDGLADDAPAINRALAAALGRGPGARVYLPAGGYRIDSPINMPPMTALHGDRAGIAGFDSSPGYGTVLKPSAAFTSAFPVSAAIVMLDCQVYPAWPVLTAQAQCSAGIQVRDVAIDGSAGPAAVDGITMYGGVLAVQLASLSIFRTSGYGINAQDNSKNTHKASPQAVKAYGVMTQHTGKTAWNRVPGDSTIVDCHTQFAGDADTTPGKSQGHGFYVQQGGNVRFIGCRADLSAGSGWVIDHAGTYTDPTVLSGCGTERNARHGVYVTNSSRAGTQWRAPVLISGCSFGEDGTGGGSGGEYAGIMVEGENHVFIEGTTVFVAVLDVAGGCPKYGLMTGKTGTRNGVPNLVQMTGGHLNYATGGRAVNDTAPAANLLIGPEVTASAGYHSNKLVLRQGTAVLAGGTATVTNPWVRSSSRIFLTPVSPGGTPGWVRVSSRSEGSFTIQSSSASDTSTIAWELTTR